MQPKDQLSTVARRFGSSLRDLLQLNPDIVASNQDANFQVQRRILHELLGLRVCVRASARACMHACASACARASSDVSIAGQDAVSAAQDGAVHLVPASDGAAESDALRGHLQSALLPRLRRHRRAHQVVQ